jgi:electron transport complex protein RnfB
MTTLLAILVLGCMALVFGAILGFASVKFHVEGDPLAEQVDAILPQTQCGQCGYPGCKPYAEAVANGEAINKCAPGGEDTIKKIMIQTILLKLLLLLKKTVLVVLNVFKLAL